MPRILVVEDEADIRDVLKMIIGNAGYEVVTAANGREGLDAARRDPPDMIITDVLMPVMDGYEFYKRLKEDPRTAIIPVLVLTARGAMEETFRTLGADGFLAKPFEDHILLAKVSALLSRPAVLSPPVLPAKPLKRKILIAGVYAEAVRAMAARLEEKGHQARTVLAAADVISRVIIFEPDLVVMNVLTAGGCTAPEIIEGIHALAKYRETPVLVYSYFRMADLGSQSLQEQFHTLDSLITACLEAGALAYMGEYKDLTFWRKIEEYL